MSSFDVITSIKKSIVSLLLHVIVDYVVCSYSLLYDSILKYKYYFLRIWRMSLIEGHTVSTIMVLLLNIGSQP